MTMSTTPPIGWAKLICPHRSTNHAIIQPSNAPAGIAMPGPSVNVQIIPADMPCVGPRCAIYHTCKPTGYLLDHGRGEPLAAPRPFVGGSE
jgi:hypothetical protein